MELSREELSKMQKSEMETSERKHFERDNFGMKPSLVGRCVCEHSLTKSLRVFSGLVDGDTESSFKKKQDGIKEFHKGEQNHLLSIFAGFNRVDLAIRLAVRGFKIISLVEITVLTMREAKDHLRKDVLVQRMGAASSIGEEGGCPKS